VVEPERATRVGVERGGLAGTTGDASDGGESIDRSGIGQERCGSAQGLHAPRLHAGGQTPAITSLRVRAIRRRTSLDSAECQTAPNAKQRQMPNSAKCRTARNAERREMPNGAKCGLTNANNAKLGA
jgi:hypothetical protein